MTNIDWDRPAAIEDLGQVVTGLRVDANRFCAVMKFARLERLVDDPLTASIQKFRDANARLSDYYDLHVEIQRAFDSGKRLNTAAYAEYIQALCKGALGDTPTIDLFTPQELDVDEKGNRLIWPHGLVAVPFDGETQLAARFLAAKQLPATREMPVVLTITHGKSVEFARQCFHDRNWYQRRVAVPAALAMDVRDPMTQVVRALERLPMARGAILWKRQMPKKGRTHIAVATFVRTAVICFAYGIGGVGMSTAPLPEGLTAADFSQRAVMWFSKVIARLGDDMRDRETFVASSPAIWAALGALGRPMLDPQVTDDDALAAIAEGLLAKIAGVDWRKGPHWIGIALKETEGGYSFAGGAKDSGSIAYKALSDPSEHVYRVIRHKADAAAA